MYYSWRHCEHYFIIVVNDRNHSPTSADGHIGVSIYTGNSGSQKPANTELIDLNPADPSAFGSADRSKEGQVIFRDRNTGITVGLTDINDKTSQAQISVQFTGKPLDLAMPTS